MDVGGENYDEDRSLVLNFIDLVCDLTRCYSRKIKPVKQMVSLPLRSMSVNPREMVPSPVYMFLL
jgi:hypothetical protein